MAIDQQVPVLEPVHSSRAEATDDRTVLALAGGLIAALVGGGIWAAIVLFANLEIGWAAWGVGILVGGAMAKITVNRDPSLGVAAAGLAVAGLLVGKLAITMGSATAVAEELVEQPQMLLGAVAWHLYETGELEPATQEEVAATLEAGDTLSDAVWADMTAQAEVRLATMTEDERLDVARNVAEGYIAQLGVVGGIMVQLSLWDLLWFGLAIITAYQLMAGARQGTAQRPA